jgi:hypothetical protein
MRYVLVGERNPLARPELDASSGQGLSERGVESGAAKPTTKNPRHPGILSTATGIRSQPLRSDVGRFTCKSRGSWRDGNRCRGAQNHPPGEVGGTHVGLHAALARRTDEAHEAFQRALALARSGHEQRLLERRIAEL